MQNFHADLFGWTDPRDLSQQKAQPQFEVPKMSATLAHRPKGGSERKTLIQPDLFQEAKPGDRIIYRSVEAVHAINGDWHVKSPRSYDSTTVHLGTLRMGAIAELARGIDHWYANRREAVLQTS